jgi:ribosomal protein S18 acetylase RimI-like enzyme
MGIEITPFYLTEVVGHNSPAPEIKEGSSLFSCGFLNEGDLVQMKNDPRGYTTEKLVHHLKMGRLCYGVKHGKNVAAFMWVDLNECNFEPCRFPLKEDEAYTFSAYTMEAFRGRNIAPYMAYHCYRELKQMGRDKVFGISEYLNRSAIKYKMKLGAKKTRLYLYFRFFRRFQRLYLIRSFS